MATIRVYMFRDIHPAEQPLKSTLETWFEDPRNLPVAELRGPKRTLAVVMRNLYWGRTHGWANLLEEHDLDPRVRVPRDLRKWRWRRRHGSTLRDARAVFLFGAQRSGTNMVTHGLAMAPEFEIYNEGDQRAFDKYRLRDRETISGIVSSSRHDYVLFKPLLDSHLAPQILDDYAGSPTPRAIWVYRDVRARARSAVAKFGDSNLRALRRWSESPHFTHWQLGDEAGPSEEVVEVLESFDFAELSPLDGAALFWLMRNRLYFKLGLHERSDVRLVSYERFIQDPPVTMRRLCDFLGFPYRSELVAHVESRPPAPGGESGILPPILELCEALSLELAEAER